MGDGDGLQRARLYYKWETIAAAKVKQHAWDDFDRNNRQTEINKSLLSSSCPLSLPPVLVLKKHKRNPHDKEL